MCLEVDCVRFFKSGFELPFPVELIFVLKDEM